MARALEFSSQRATLPVLNERGKGEQCGKKLVWSVTL